MPRVQAASEQLGNAAAAPPGKLVTFDAYTRGLVASLGGADGSDLGRDPVAAAFLLMFDSDYLLKARIIPSPDGSQYVSISDVTGLNIEDPHVRRAKEAYYASKFAWQTRSGRS